MSARVRSVSFRAVLVLPPSDRRKELSTGSGGMSGTWGDPAHTTCSALGALRRRRIFRRGRRLRGLHRPQNTARSVPNCVSGSLTYPLDALVTERRRLGGLGLRRGQARLLDFSRLVYGIACQKCVLGGCSNGARSPRRLSPDTTGRMGPPVPNRVLNGHQLGRREHRIGRW